MKKIIDIYKNIKAKNYQGFNVGELIEHLQTIPKDKRVLLNMDGEEPLNIIQVSYQNDNSIVLNSFYEDEFEGDDEYRIREVSNDKTK